jgi:hypothetical protein
MGVGSFGDNGELHFEIQLVAADGEKLSVEALLPSLNNVLGKVTPHLFSRLGDILFCYINV